MTMLNHQPFRDWLFSEEPLDPQAALQLQEHLHTCEECQRLRLAWNGAQYFFQNAGQTTPAPGFVNRFQERLAVQRMRKQHKLAWVFFFAAAGLATLMLTILGWQMVEAFSSPQSLLLVLFLRVAGIVTLLNSVGNYLSVFSAMIPGLPVVSLIFLTGFTSMISVLWLATYRRLRDVRRIV